MKTTRSRNKIALVSSLCAAALFAVSVAVNGYAQQPIQTTILADGNIDHSVLFDGPAFIRMATQIYQPGANGPWHHHPGRAYVVVKQGTLTEEDGCGGTEEFSAGQSFEESHGRIHRVRNLGSVPVEIFVTIVVPAGSPTTIPTPTGGPLCGPPVTVEECKRDGWRQFNHPRSFTSKGDCIQFVKTGE